MTNAITVQELQQLSAGAIRALPGSVPIKNGEETVAMLLPIRKPSREQIAVVFARIDAAAAARTPEEQAAIEAFLDERERG